MKNLMKVMEFLTRDKLLTLKDEHLGGSLMGRERVWVGVGVDESGYVVVSMRVKCLALEKGELFIGEVSAILEVAWDR